MKDNNNKKRPKDTPPGEGRAHKSRREEMEGNTGQGEKSFSSQGAETRSMSRSRSTKGRIRSPNEDAPKWIQEMAKHWNEAITNTKGPISRELAGQLFESALQVGSEAFSNSEQNVDEKLETLSKKLLEKITPLYSKVASTGKPFETSKPRQGAKQKCHQLTVLTPTKLTEEEFNNSFKQDIGKILTTQAKLHHVVIRKSIAGNAVITFSCEANKKIAKAQLQHLKWKINDQDDREIPIFVKGLSAKKQDQESIETDLFESNPTLGKEKNNIKIRWMERKKNDRTFYVPKLLVKKTLAKQLLDDERIYSNITYNSYLVTLWKLRATNCYKCLSDKHNAFNCTSETSKCKKCSGTGHKDFDCKSKEKCQICFDLGLNHEHTCEHNQCPTLIQRSEKMNEELNKLVLNYHG